MIPGIETQIENLEIDGTQFWFERSDKQVFYGEAPFLERYLIEIRIMEIGKPPSTRLGTKFNEYVRLEVFEAGHKTNVASTGRPLHTESLPKKCQRWGPESIGRLALQRSRLWWQRSYIGLAHSL